MRSEGLHVACSFARAGGARSVDDLMVVSRIGTDDFDLLQNNVVEYTDFRAANLEIVAVASSLAELNDALGAIVRDLVAARDAALSDALAKLDRLRINAERNGIPFVPGDMTESLGRAVGVGSINSDISDSVEDLIAALNVSDNSDNSDEDYSEFFDEEDEEGQLDEWDFGGEGEGSK